MEPNEQENAMYRRSGSSLITDGVLTMLVGIVLLFLTSISLTAVIYLLAAYAIVYGISQLFAGRGERDVENNPSAFWAIGIFSILAGITLLFFRGAGLALAVFLISAYAIITGIAEIVTSYALRNEIRGYGWLVGAGIVRLIFGLYILFNPLIALATLISLVAIYALVVGAITIIYGYAIRQKTHTAHAPQTH